MFNVEKVIIISLMNIKYFGSDLQRFGVGGAKLQVKFCYIIGGNFVGDL